MNHQVELDWPANGDAAGFMWSFGETLPRVGETIDDTETGKSGVVKNVVWFLDERGVKHVRLVVSS